MGLTLESQFLKGTVVALALLVSDYYAVNIERK
jgi:hypothetical protein